MITVVFYLASAGLVLTLALLGPIFVGLLASETDVAFRFMVYLMLGIFVFAAPVFAILGRLRRIPQVGGLVLAVLVWTVLPLAAAVPIIDISSLSIVDSVFEAVSGLTTAGSTTWKTLEDVPQALIFWRVELQ